MPFGVVFEVQGDFVGNNPVVTASADFAGNLFDECAGFSLGASSYSALTMDSKFSTVFMIFSGCLIVLG